MKKILSILLSLALVFGTLSMLTFAVGENELKMSLTEYSSSVSNGDRLIFCLEVSDGTGTTENIDPVLLGNEKQLHCTIYNSDGEQVDAYYKYFDWVEEEGVLYYYQGTLITNHFFGLNDEEDDFHFEIEIIAGDISLRDEFDFHYLGSNGAGEPANIDISFPTTVYGGDRLYVTVTDESGVPVQAQNVEVVFTDKDGADFPEEYDGDRKASMWTDSNGEMNRSFNFGTYSGQVLITVKAGEIEKSVLTETIAPPEEVCFHEYAEWIQVDDGCALICPECEASLEWAEHDWQIEGEYDIDEDYEMFGCEEERLRFVRCSRCGSSSSIFIAPLGHEFDEDGVCYWCGKNIEEIYPMNIEISIEKKNFNYFNSVPVTFKITDLNGETEDLPWFMEKGKWFSYYATIYNADGDLYEGFVLKAETNENQIYDFVFDNIQYEDAGEYTVEIEIMESGAKASTTFYYTAEMVPCEKDHDFQSFVCYDEGHCRRCIICGYEDEAGMEEHVPMEPEEHRFGDKKDPCKETYVRCAVCDCVIEYSVEHCGRTVEYLYEEKPSCLYEGYSCKETYCEGCGEYLDSDITYIEPLGHNVEDGICTRCHQEMDCIATLTLDKTEIGEGELLTVTYTLKDRNGDPIGEHWIDAGFRYSAEDTGYEWVDMYTDEKGQAVAYLRLYQEGDFGKQIGLYTFVAQVWGMEGSYVSQNFTFTGEEIEPEDYKVEVDVDITNYSDSADAKYICTVLDQNGKPVPALNVTIEIYQGDELLYDYIRQTDENGRAYLWDYFYIDESTAGTYTVKAIVGEKSDSATFELHLPEPIIIDENGIAIIPDSRVSTSDDDTTYVEVDMAYLDEEPGKPLRGVRLSAETVKRIIEAGSSKGEIDNIEVDLKMVIGLYIDEDHFMAIGLDSAAMDAIAEQAGDQDVTIIAAAANAGILNEKQIEALSESTVANYFEAAVIAGDKKITDMQGGLMFFEYAAYDSMTMSEIPARAVLLMEDGTYKDIAAIANDSNVCAVYFLSEVGNIVAGDIVDKEIVIEPEDITVDDNGTATVPDSLVEIEEGKDVTIDVKNEDKPADSVLLSGETVDKIADAEVGTEIKLTETTVVVDAKAMETISEKANGNDVIIAAEIVEEAALNDKQKAAIKDQETQLVLSLAVTAGETPITEFGEGKITMTVPFTMPEGVKAEDVKLYGLAADGTMNELSAVYANGAFTFEIAKSYANLVFAGAAPETPVEPEPSGDTSLVLCEALLLVCLAAAAILVSKKDLFGRNN